MYKACLQVLKVHLHAKNKEEATQSNFCAQVRNWVKLEENWPVRHTRSEHIVQFFMGATQWEGAAHWVSCATHTAKGMKLLRIIPNCH